VLATDGELPCHIDWVKSLVSVGDFTCNPVLGDSVILWDIGCFC
jgi:hypothetical protein